MKFLLLVVIFFSFSLQCVYAPVPTYREIVKGSYATRNELLKAYFFPGYSYKDISLFLLTLHDIVLSMHSLKKIFKRLGLKRNNTMDREKLISLMRAINKEKSDTGANFKIKINS